jgi:hypothetical protein
MKKNWNSGLTSLVIILLIAVPEVSNGQSEKSFIKKYLRELPSVNLSKALTKYRMTAVYTNRDLYGKFTDKLKVVGDYTRGLPGDSVVWNNVAISHSQKYEDPFPQGSVQAYMENFKYVPSDNMVKPEAFKDFPLNTDNVFARNLVWDMYTFDIFSWQNYDSLKLNIPYVIPNIQGEFDMAEIGKYEHNKIILCWKGVTVFKGELCAVIEFNAIDNLIQLSMGQIKTRGTEQYWGTVYLSLKTKLIEEAIMYSGTIQEIEIAGMKDKFLVKTIRELNVEKIQ